MGYDINIMGTKKQPTKHVSTRLPKNLYDFIQNRAKRWHGEDFTASIIAILSRAQEIILEEEGVLAQYWIEKWKKERDERKKEKEPKGADQVEKLKKQKETKPDPK